MRLAGRFALTALAIGVVGGAVTAALTVLFENTDSPAGAVLAVGLPVLLVALIGWRLAGIRGVLRAPDGPWLAGIAALSVVVTVVVLGIGQAEEFADDVPHNLGVTLLVLGYGAVVGALPAVAVIVVGVPVLLLVRAVRSDVALTLTAMAVTCAFALRVGPDLGTGVVVGLATALAGAGAAFTARWTLSVH